MATRVLGIQCVVPSAGPNIFPTGMWLLLAMILSHQH